MAKFNPVVEKVFIWQYARDKLDTFYTRLFNLILAAEKKDLERLAHVYPMEVLWVERWMQAENTWEFFIEYLGEERMSQYIKTSAVNNYG